MPKKPGRPIGTTQYGERKKRESHYMTPSAHRWVREHKAEIESGTATMRIIESLSAGLIETQTSGALLVTQTPEKHH